MGENEDRREWTGGQGDGSDGIVRSSLHFPTSEPLFASRCPQRLGHSIDLLLDDEMALEAAFRPLLDLARRRRLSPPAEAAALALLDATTAVRRLRGAVVAEAAA